MTPYKRHILALIATTILAGIIAYLTLTPPRPQTSNGLLSDKVYHAIAFCALVFPGALLYRRSLIWLIPAALLFGAAIELVQPLVGRSAEMADFVADVIGVGCGLVLGLTSRVWLLRTTSGRRVRRQLVRVSR